MKINIHDSWGESNYSNYSDPSDPPVDYVMLSFAAFLQTYYHSHCSIMTGLDLNITGE